MTFAYHKRAPDSSTCYQLTLHILICQLAVSNPTKLQSDAKFRQIFSLVGQFQHEFQHFEKSGTYPHSQTHTPKLFQKTLKREHFLKRKITFSADFLLFRFALLLVFSPGFFVEYVKFLIFWREITCKQAKTRLVSAAHFFFVQLIIKSHIFNPI